MALEALDTYDTNIRTLEAPVMRGILLGIGNEILCDDAIGIRLARRLAEDDVAPGWEIAWGELGPLETAERLAGHDAAILIDAMRVTDRPPGGISAFTLGALRQTEHLGWSHGMNLQTALRFLVGQGTDLPRQLAIIGIAIADNTLLSETMTPALEKGFEAILVQVKEMVLHIAREMGEREDVGRWEVTG